MRGRRRRLSVIAFALVLAASGTAYLASNDMPQSTSAGNGHASVIHTNGPLLTSSGFPAP